MGFSRGRQGREISFSGFVKNLGNGIGNGLHFGQTVDGGKLPLGIVVAGQRGRLLVVLAQTLVEDLGVVVLADRLAWQRRRAAERCEYRVENGRLALPVAAGDLNESRLYDEHQGEPWAHLLFGTALREGLHAPTFQAWAGEQPTRDRYQIDHVLATNAAKHAVLPEKKGGGIAR